MPAATGPVDVVRSAERRRVDPRRREDILNILQEVSMGDGNRKEDGR